MINVVQVAIYHRASNGTARAATSAAKSALKLILRLPLEVFVGSSSVASTYLIWFDLALLPTA